MPGKAGWWLGKTWRQSDLAPTWTLCRSQPSKGHRKDVLGLGRSSEATKEGGKEVGQTGWLWPAHNQGQDLSFFPSARGPGDTIQGLPACREAASWPCPALGFPEGPPPRKEQE